jgi:hypothetical protein
MVRVNRQMRKLEWSKRFGSIYNKSSIPTNMTIFCPACPQPGINLPPDWTLLPKWSVRRTNTMDGNFVADLIKPRRPDLDVKLTNGQGFMADDLQYQDYLKVAKERPIVSFPFELMVYFTNPSRGHLVENIERSTELVPAIDVILKLQG